MSRCKRCATTRTSCICPPSRRVFQRALADQHIFPRGGQLLQTVVDAHLQRPGFGLERGDLFSQLRDFLGACRRLLRLLLGELQRAAVFLGHYNETRPPTQGRFDVDPERLLISAEKRG